MQLSIPQQRAENVIALENEQNRGDPDPACCDFFFSQLKLLIVGACEHVAFIQGIVVDPIRGNLAPVYIPG